MGEQLHSLINVTIHYPDGNPSFWTLLAGQLRQVVVRIEKLEIPQEFIGKSYDQDAQYRLAFQQWVNRLWEAKDARLEHLHQQFPPA
ncbi:putative acyltransferase YihG [compost metagenome]